MRMFNGKQAIGVNETGHSYLDVSPLAFFNRCASIVCAGGLGDVALAGRHWDDGDGGD